MVLICLIIIASLHLCFLLFCYFFVLLFLILGVSRLLLNIREKCIEPKNYGLLLAFLNYGSSDVSKQNIINKHIEMRKDTKIAKTLIEYIKQDEKNNSDIILQGLNNAINKMIKNKEIINDSLLFIANIIDQKMLVNNLEIGLKDVLGRDIGKIDAEAEAEAELEAELGLELKTEEELNMSNRSISDLLEDHDDTQTRNDTIKTISLGEKAATPEIEINIRDQSWYKRNLLDSNIWCIQATTDNTISMGDGTDEKEAEKEIETPKATDKDKGPSLSTGPSSMKATQSVPVNNRNSINGINTSINTQNGKNGKQFKRQWSRLGSVMSDEETTDFDDISDFSAGIDNKSNNNNNSNSNGGGLKKRIPKNLLNSFYDKAMDNVLNDELEKLRSFLQNEIVKQRNVDKFSWNKLINYSDFNGLDSNIIRQDIAISRFDNKPDLMVIGGTKATYKQKQLFVDIDTGFNGADEYDYSAYLTNLLINAQFSFVFLFLLMFWIDFEIIIVSCVCVLMCLCCVCCVCCVSVN